MTEALPSGDEAAQVSKITKGARRMIGLGRKEKDGSQVRIEHRGRKSRFAHRRCSGSRREAVRPCQRDRQYLDRSPAFDAHRQGSRIALQSGQFRLQGRWNAGPLGFDLSKSGVSASMKTQTGTFIFLKPLYPSFKLAGVEVRGKNAMYLQLATLALTGAALMAVLVFRLAVFAGWLGYLAAMFLGDLMAGFARGARTGSRQGEPAICEPGDNRAQPR
jgi:hypothetical protein